MTLPKLFWLIVFLSLALASVFTNPQHCCTLSDSTVRSFFEQENELLRIRQRQLHLAEYEYNTNVNEKNRQRMINIAVENAKKDKDLAQRIDEAGYDRQQSSFIKRQVAMLTDLGHGVLNESDFEELQNAISSMQTNYATTTVCSYTNKNKCGLLLEPHIQERLKNSRDPKELEHYWLQWYNKAGTPMRSHFTKYVQLSNKAANLNGYRSYADYWIHFYEDSRFESNLDNAYEDILPFYKQLHAYVRYRLRQYYGDDIMTADGNIPMHLLGNLWGQTWDEPIELFTPYPEKPFIDVTFQMKKQKYTVKKLFELGDEFFISLNMRGLPESFWNKSVLVRPTNRPIICHASAWDMYENSDVRIKMCTEVDNHYLYVVHHELGHIQYYLQYEHQPTIMRGAPNPGFHEAVGDVIALSVSSPKHLHAIGLSPVSKLDDESRINELFKRALQKVVFLPFAYSLDKFRYAVFREEYNEGSWNSVFWQMRSDFSGVEPPVRRTDNDFDPPAKYHVDADVEYLRYFAAHIFQFQFHKALCIKADQYKPCDECSTLDNCDIYNSGEAGCALSKLLSQGSSRHWQEVLQEFSGEKKMDPSALLEYFQPLHDWLKQENQRLGIPIGWEKTKKSGPICFPPFST